MSDIAVIFVMVRPAYPNAAAGKPYNKIDNREVFMRTVELYAKRDQVKQRVVCVLPDEMQRINEKYSAHLAFAGVSVTAGGPDWFGAVARGLEKLKPEISTVFIHDACRPAIPYTLLDALEAAVITTGAAAPVSPVTGSLVRVKNNQISAAVDGNGIYAVGSPQIFRKDVLLEAYQRRAELKTAPADDAALVRACGATVTTVVDWSLNLRVDSEDAVKLATDAVKHLPKPRSTAAFTPFEEAQW